MKNRIVLFILSLVVIGLFNVQELSAQKKLVKLGSSSNSILVNQRDGGVFYGVFRLQIQTLNSLDVSSPWSIAVGLNKPISIGETGIDAKRIKIGFNRVDNDAGLSLAHIGADNQTKFILNEVGSFVPIMMVPTNAVIQKWKTYQFYFDIVIEGGEYLEELIRDNPKYPLDLTFAVSFFTEEGKVTEHSSTSVGIQIARSLGGSYPEPDFGFVVNADASLKFATPEDYTKQVESTENSSIKVTSKDKGYEVWVNSGDANFNGDSSAPPVNVVSVKVGDSTPITLSNTVAPGQLVYAGNATNKTTKELNVRYFITSEKSKELVKYGGNNYTTTLTYTLIPN